MHNTMLIMGTRILLGIMIILCKLSIVNEHVRNLDMTYLTIVLRRVDLASLW